MTFNKDWWKQILRKGLRPLVRSVRELRVSLYGLSIRKQIARIDVPVHSMAVNYLTRNFPTPPPPRTQLEHGGAVKLIYLNEALPHSARSCNVLYAVSSVSHPQTVTILEGAKTRGIKIVWNQNGTYYRGWYGAGWERANRPLARALHLADYVFYQSQFCQRAADKFLGRYTGPHEILFNAIDIDYFSPVGRLPLADELVLCTLGSVMSFYRLAAVLRATRHVADRGRKVRLIVAGNISHPAQAALRSSLQALIAELRLSDRVTFLPSYTQQAAPDIYRQAHILVHAKYNDPCPTVVEEAMACGLPVVYSASGGVPELVGEEAGVGVPATLDWEHNHPPDPDLLAEAIERIAADWPHYAAAARQRAVEQFNLADYVERHRRVFEDVLQLQ